MSTITVDGVLVALRAAGGFRVRPRKKVKAALWRDTDKGTVALVTSTWLQRWIVTNVHVDCPANMASFVLASELSGFPVLTEDEGALS